MRRQEISYRYARRSGRGWRCDRVVVGPGPRSDGPPEPDQSLTMRWRGHFGLVSASDAATIPRAPASRKGTPRPCPRRPPPVGSLPTIPSGWSPTSSPSPEPLESFAPPCGTPPATGATPPPLPLEAPSGEAYPVPTLE